jgi:hypothetical protein
MEILKKISTAEVVAGECSFFFPVGLVDLCVSYTPSFHSQASLQREAAHEKLQQCANQMSNHEKALYSTSCSESLPQFYQRYLKSAEWGFFLNIARLCKLWKFRNIPQVRLNPLFLVLLAFRIAEDHVALSGDQPPSATFVLQQLMEALKSPETISVLFDTFLSPADLLGNFPETGKAPTLLDPTNFRNNLAETVQDWEALKEAAAATLANIKSRSSLASIFPKSPPTVLPSSPTIVRASKGG